MLILSSFIGKFYKFLLWFHPKILWSADICTVKDVESVNCIQYTLFYSNYDDSAPSQLQSKTQIFINRLRRWNSVTVHSIHSNLAKIYSRFYEHSW